MSGVQGLDQLRVGLSETRITPSVYFAVNALAGHIIQDISKLDKKGRATGETRRYYPPIQGRPTFDETEFSRLDTYLTMMSALQLANPENKLESVVDTGVNIMIHLNHGSATIKTEELV